jgi:DNA polymerase I-like protein with 3'-5' exonuclease and polymerase domains
MMKNVQLPKHIQNPDPRIYWSNNYVVLDFETTNRDKGSALNPDNRLVLSTWTVGNQHQDYRPGLGIRYSYSKSLPGALGRMVQSADFIVAQHAKFELQWLEREGIDTSQLCVYDTMLGEFVRLGNRRGDKDLDSLCKRYGVATKGPLVKSLLEGGVCPSDIPFGWLIEYGCGDTRNTEKVFLAQREELGGMGLLAVLFTRCLMTVVLADIEKYGVCLDKKKVYHEYDRARNQQEDAEGRLASSYPGINFASSKQLAILLYDKLGFAEPTKQNGDPDRTSGGNRRTDESTIDNFECSTEAQKDFKEHIARHRTATTKLKFLVKLKECCDNERVPIIHAQFNQAIAQNHRLTSTGRKYKIQLQNIAREYKELSRARYDGWYVGESDGMQLEFRAAAELGEDDVALNDIREHVDVHKNTASVYEHIRPEKVTKDQRQKWKPETFRPLYGSKGQTKEQKKYAKWFQKRYNKIYKTQEEWTFTVLKEKKLVTPWGLIFYWPDTTMMANGYIKNTTNIFNYPVSSLATAEIIPITTVYTWHYMRALEMMSFLVNTVHDSVVGEIAPHERETWTEICRETFTRRVYRYLSSVYGLDLVVPLGAEIKFGTNWSHDDGGESKYELDPAELKEVENV